MKMKLIMENFRKFNEQMEWAGFHGKGGRPNQHSISGRGGGMYQLGCLEDVLDSDTGEGDFENPVPDGTYDTWEKPGDAGCPQFDDGELVTDRDVEIAVEFLNDRKPVHLVAYSRGGGVAFLAHADSGLQHRPKVHYVASAWKKSAGSTSAGSHSSGGFIIHGTKDVRIPLKDSVELSIMTGLPLAVFPGFGHLMDILNVAEKPNMAETVVPSSKLKSLPQEVIDQLPTWEGKVEFWAERPADGNPGRKSDQVLSIEDAQQKWYETYLK